MSVLLKSRQVLSICPSCMLKLSRLSVSATTSIIPPWSKAGLLEWHSYSTSSTDPDLPIIRVPKQLQKKVNELRDRRRPIQWRGRVFTARPGREIISSKRQEFNHYQNQTYDKFAPPKLASQGWKHRKACGDYFTILAYRGNPSIIPTSGSQEDDKPVKTFQDFKLDQSLIEGLRAMDISIPTSIQLASILVIQQGKNTLCAAETGSGKTLAYLLPLMHRLLLEARLTDEAVEAGRPRSIVLVPVGELAVQVWEVAKTLAETTGLSVKRLDGEKSLKYMKNDFQTPVDVVISTPGPVLNAVRQNFASLDTVSHIVIDESDTMLDDSFREQTLNVLRMVNVGPGKPCKVTAPGEAQLTLIGATMPRRATAILEEIVPSENLEIISTPHLHRIMPHVHQKFLRLHSHDKAVKIVEIVKKEVKRGISSIIFCNTTATCDWLSRLLEENGVRALRLHSKMGSKSRHGVMNSFKTGKANVLVCTDIASRGVDTVQVQHVINFDFPNFMSDYIHRAGRVGRVGSHGSGHVTSFIVHKWDVELVNKIEKAVRIRESLPSVDANIKQKHLSRLIDEDLQELGIA